VCSITHLKWKSSDTNRPVRTLRAGVELAQVVQLHPSWEGPGWVRPLMAGSEFLASATLSRHSFEFSAQHPAPSTPHLGKKDSGESLSMVAALAQVDGVPFCQRSASHSRTLDLALSRPWPRGGKNAIP